MSGQEGIGIGRLHIALMADWDNMDGQEDGSIDAGYSYVRIEDSTVYRRD